MSQTDRNNGAPGGKCPSRWQQSLIFLRTYFRNPKMLGAVMPSSRFVVDQLLKGVAWEQAKVIVEYGPGAGTFTAEILKRMRPDATLLAIELNPGLARFIRTTFSDPRLQVVEGSAARIEDELARLGHPAADYVISGIPFSTMPPQERETIIRRTRQALRPGGAFLVYQVSGAVGPYLQSAFSTVARRVEPLNLIPLRLFYCVP